MLAIPGAAVALPLRTFADGMVLRAAIARAARIICIGAGVVGLEVAASARARGASVLVLEAGPVPMGRALSPEGAAYVDRLHRQAGVEIRYNVSIEEIVSKAGGGYRVHFDGMKLDCDVVVAAVGMQRNGELATAAGLEADNGILVDSLGRTSTPDIYAAGDIAALFHPFYGRTIRLETWAHAQNHGIAVGKAMCGGTDAYEDLPWFWSDQHKINLQVLGFASGPARTILSRDEPEGRFVAVHLAEDGTLVGVTAVDQPREIRAARSLIRGRVRLDADRFSAPGVSLATLAKEVA